MPPQTLGGVDVRAVTLDLDDTLWPFAPVARAISAALEGWLREHAPATHRRYGGGRAAMELAERVRTERPDIAHDVTAVRRATLQRMFEAAGDDPERVEEVFGVVSEARQRVAPYPDAVPALRRLAARFPLVAVTNGNADLERIGLADLFVTTVAPDAVGAPKPDRRMFLRACEHVGEAPEHVLHAGDDLVTDVMGALDAGLHAVWLHRDLEGEAPAGALRAYDMTDLADLVGA